MTTDAGNYGIGSTCWPGLAKVLEESGELGQVLGKIMGSDGRTEYWDGTDLRVGLCEEIADLEAALLFFKDKNLTQEERDEVRSRTFRKFEQFLHWHQDVKI